jgi:hypothetical protein
MPYDADAWACVWCGERFRTGIGLVQEKTL